MFIDSHIHLDDFVEKNTLEDKLKNAEKHMVNKMIAIGGYDKSNFLSISLSKKYPNKIFATAGYDRIFAKAIIMN